MAKESLSTDTSSQPHNADQPVINLNAEGHSIILYPVITEKSYNLFNQRQYSFIVTKDANKFSIKKAVESLYSVKISAIRVLRVKPQQTFVRGKKGKTSGFKKAVVSLQNGYSINI